MAIVGVTNVGKSALVAALTNATPEVSDAPYTTWEPTPGMMLVDNVQVQLIDTPPLSRDYVEPELMSLIRRSDLILLVVDVQTQPVQQLEESIAILEEHRIVPLHRQGQLSGGSALRLQAAAGGGQQVRRPGGRGAVRDLVRACSMSSGLSSPSRRRPAITWSN